MKTLFVYDPQPLTVLGVQTLLSKASDFVVLETTEFIGATVLACQINHGFILADKSFGLKWLSNIDRSKTAVIVWGNFITEHEVVTMIQSGVRGVLSKTCSTEKLLECFQAVGEGKNWIDPSFSQLQWTNEYLRSKLTPREQQVRELVERGMKNKEIAKELNIRPGTVKIHLKHIFEKMGVTNRYRLTLVNLYKMDS